MCQWGANRNPWADYKMSSFPAPPRTPNQRVANRRPQIEHIMAGRRAAWSPFGRWPCLVLLFVAIFSDGEGATFDGNSRITYDISGPGQFVKTLNDYIRLRFRTNDPDGLLLFADSNQGDYIILELIRGRLYINMDIGKISITHQWRIQGRGTCTTRNPNPLLGWIGYNQPVHELFKGRLPNDIPGSATRQHVIVFLCCFSFLNWSIFVQGWVICRTLLKTHLRCTTIAPSQFELKPKSYFKWYSIIVRLTWSLIRVNGSSITSDWVSSHAKLAGSNVRSLKMLVEVTRPRGPRQKLL